MYRISRAFGKCLWWLLRIFCKETSTLETDRVSAEQGWRIAEAEESGDEKEPVKKKGKKGADANKGRGKGSAKGKSTRKGKAAAAKGKGKVSFLSCTAHTHTPLSPHHT